MGTELFDQLGVNPDDARIRAALDDAHAAEHLIDTLVELRLKLGATQADLAEEMETTQSAISKFERAGGDPHLSTLQRYARAVGARLRLAVVIERKEPTWQANYVVAPPSESLPEDSEPPAVVVPIIGLAS